MVHLLLAVIYLSFISLGLPDSLLGAAWPSMYDYLSVPVSYAGIVSMIIAAGTIFSSLQSDRLTRLFGTGKVTAFSVAMTAISLFGFSVSDSFWQLCFWAVPYGLGAGSVDASLNNYVALHYASRHMSWLHCMWGVGTSIGPCVMGYALTSGLGWNAGYRFISIFQIGLTGILLLSIPLWKKRPSKKDDQESNQESNLSDKALSLSEILRISGTKQVMIMFFCYCALESTAGLWAASYLALSRGISAESAARCASFFYIGITVGRGVSGFLTIKLNDSQMIRLGQCFVAIGIITMILPFGKELSLVSFILVGLGCAPIYPCIIHSTPAHFGADKSQAIIGVQMASAYTGTCLMPPVFGWLAGNVSVSLLPLFLSFFLLLMFFMYNSLLKQTKNAVN